MSRWIAAALALMMGLNGVYMLVAPQGWYDAVPGVPLTGLFNPHFVRDCDMPPSLPLVGRVASRSRKAAER